ncbi:MAG: transcriptional regulator, partial [Rhodopirellula sp.]|nr:transcriptional regulator [Rhodopirellula sp.]
VPGGRRDALRAHLSERKIGSEIYYPVPMHQQECFQDIPFRHDGLEHTEAASAEVLNLPIFPSLTEAEQIRVVDSVASFFQQANRAAA